MPPVAAPSSGARHSPPPRCLLELYYAMKNTIPVIVFALAHHEFTPRSAREQLLDMQSTLPPEAVALITEHLQKEGDSWEDFEALVTEAIDPTGTGVGAPPKYQVWNSMGADAQVGGSIGSLSSLLCPAGRLVWCLRLPSHSLPALPPVRASTHWATLAPVSAQPWRES